jgi:hypothetical protein
MDNELIDQFFNETLVQFEFLEKEHGYKMVERRIRADDHFPDSEAIVQYISPLISIEIFWYFASAVIGVVFIRIEKGKIPNNPDIINLYELANYLSEGKEDMFLLKDTLNVQISKIKMREKLINKDLKGIVENIAAGTRRYATNLIQGDTALFRNTREIRKGVGGS